MNWNKLHPMSWCLLFGILMYFHWLFGSVFLSSPVSIFSLHSSSFWFQKFLEKTNFHVNFQAGRIKRKRREKKHRNLSFAIMLFDWELFPSFRIILLSLPLASLFGPKNIITSEYKQTQFWQSDSLIIWSRFQQAYWFFSPDSDAIQTATQTELYLHHDFYSYATLFHYSGHSRW